LGIARALAAAGSEVFLNGFGKPEEVAAVQAKIASDFQPTGIRLRWEAGYADTIRALRRSPWDDACDPLEGAILHEPLPEVAAAIE
jgi:Patatin phospholipase